MSRPRVTLGSIAMGGLTPLLDTLFILLFALLALAQVRRKEEREEVRIELPTVERDVAQGESAAVVLAVEIDASSKVTVAGSELEITTREVFDRAVEIVLQGAPAEDVTVEIRAHRDARHGVAVELLQHLRLSGYTSVELIALGTADLGGPFGGSTLDGESR